MSKSKTTFSQVYAYGRCSSDPQADGNSFDRQREAVEKRLAELGLSDIPVRWVEDPGMSAYKGHHLKTGELGKFLEEARKGALRKDGIFVCESVSRASRQGAFVLLTMLNALMDAGLSVLFLDQPAPFTRDNMPRFLAVQLTLLADLAQEESRIKSGFAKDNWDRRRADARANAGKVVFTRECPNWLEVTDGKYKTIPERVDAIKTVFEYAQDGFGISKLVRLANTNKLAVPGKGQMWHMSLIKRVLTNRALIGEFQPYIHEGGARVPDGEPIQGFYPVVIDSDLFFSVQALRAKAKHFPKRRDGNNFNYLMGIAKCECGGSWRRLNKNSGAQEGYALYGCSKRMVAATNCPNINARLFDHAFVGFALTHVPGMLTSGENPHSERMLSLEAQIATTAIKKANVMAAIEDSPDLRVEFSGRLRELIAEQRRLSEELEVLRAQEAPPPGFSFGEALEVFMPAYLDVFPSGTPEFEDAYRARTLFRTRIMQSMTSVLVVKDRSKGVVTLKNGITAEFEIDSESPRGDFSPPDDHEMGAQEEFILNETRKAGLRVGRRINNARPPEEE